jgi:hypothetical protein
MARFGMRAEMDGWRLDGAVGVGLTEAAPAWEVRVGATLAFDRGSSRP